MTTRFRINSVALATARGTVSYTFSSDLTVLAGKTGVGKTTLLELIKYGFGADGALADVVRKHVHEVTLDVSVGDNRYSLTRSVNPAKRRTVQVVDLVAQDVLLDHNTDTKQPSLNTLLMTALGLPDDMRAAPTGSSSKAGARVSFADVFSFLYVPQAAINRDIAHSRETYREPKRKTVFQLLFGLTNDEILALRSAYNTRAGALEQAEREYKAVLAFLRDSRTTGREEAMQALAEAVADQATATAEQAALREAADPVSDRETQALRDLLNQAEQSLAEMRSTVADLVRRQAETTSERRQVQRDLHRLHRMRDAGERLADIEFVVCPRCMQSLTERKTPEGCCRVCQLPDPVPPAGDTPRERYEVDQLADQLVEMDDHLYVVSQRLEDAAQAVGEREELVKALSAKIDSRTTQRISPRLQAFSDATERLAIARTRQEQLEATLRQWDRAGDLGKTVDAIRADRERIKREIGLAEDMLSQRRSNLISALSDELLNTALALGIPGVKTASIHPTNYLPLLNGLPFAEFSPPGGGIVTATQVAYWTSILTVALRDRTTKYPAFLLIDTPRLALNTSEELCAALYRRLVTLADANPGRVQLIIADNELPPEYRRDYDEIDFSYDNPTVPTVPHPGPAAVQLLTDSASKDAS